VKPDSPLNPFTASRRAGRELGRKSEQEQPTRFQDADSAIPLPDPKAERKRERVMLHGDLPSPLNPPTGCRFCTRCPMATDLCHSSEPPLAPCADGRLVACHFV
jgi:oligopeptide/dipeptide ABC transporter ATP-binding protein